MLDKTFKLSAKTFHGLEKVLASELKKVGAKDIQIAKRVVNFTGDKAVIYRANYSVRTALNILQTITHFQAKSSEELYHEIKKIQWENYLSLDNTFAIDRTVYSQIHTHSQFAALKTKDGIADYFSEKFQKRPSVNVKDPDIKIHLHIAGSQCTMSLDTSGEALFKRKYRKDTEKAPLNEILAAGLVMLSDYKDIEYFYDPMCGSGTILIEAARIFMNIPPQFNRKKFAFQNFKDYDYKLWFSIKREIDKKIKKDIPLKIIGTDISEQAVLTAQNNIGNAGLRTYISIVKKDFLHTKFENKKGLIITNPPYDIRIQSDNINDLYKLSGNTLKKGYKGWNAYIFTGYLKGIKHIGLKYSRKIKLYNGKIECVYLKYELY
jgi:putative N6-adenine-specific DNA methylase